VWQQRILAQLDSWSALEQNWDLAGALPNDRKTRQRARAFLTQLPPITPEPALRPSPAGGVIVEWNLNDCWVVVEFETTGDGAACGRSIDDDQPLAVNPEIIAYWLADCSARAQ
jgi:hypothetical protein